MHQVGGDVNMHRREAGREKDVADFVRRAEICAGLGDDAGRAVGGMAATAIERLLKSIDKKNADAASGDRAAQLLDIEEFASGVPFALAVDLLESVSLGLRQPEAQPRAEIDANAELCIHRLSAREYVVEWDSGERKAAEMKADGVGERISRGGHAEGGAGARADDAVWRQAGFPLEGDDGIAGQRTEITVHGQIGARKKLSVQLRLQRPHFGTNASLAEIGHSIYLRVK